MTRQLTLTIDPRVQYVPCTDTKRDAQCWPGSSIFASYIYKAETEHYRNPTHNVNAQQW